MEMKEKIRKLRDFGVNAEEWGILRLLSLPNVKGPPTDIHAHIHTYIHTYIDR